MGIRMDKDGSLLVVDAYFGLFRVNKTDGAYETLYTTSFHVAQKQPRFLTDLDIGPDGKIYFVDASTKYYKNQYHYALLEMSSSGRLLMYDPKTKVTLQLADQLAYPFGVQLSKDKTGVLITSPLLHAIYRYDLKTRNVSVWTEGLPGMPLGIRYSESSDSYWLAMSSPRSVERPNMFENLAKSPSNRRYAAKFVSMDMIETLRQEHGFTNEAMVAEVTASGTIGRVLQDSNTNPLGAVTEAQHVNGVLYTSSFFGADAVHTVNLKHKSRS
ncbi:adipocyte plasma membrane-associated protein [Aplysia californica]|uniref:Adipocyte plasma membrane-associated protein n=1 Tax=Aplysia californica TaxID=6500 RepID=A0ABM0ZZK8_APLCA|nr:adipocyte plasma membrane-associated protein [Aplysia californica]